jgi:vacuolar-type H+-ATPase subunit F/Vma7
MRVSIGFLIREKDTVNTFRINGFGIRKIQKERTETIKKGKRDGIYNVSWVHERLVPKIDFH